MHSPFGTIFYGIFFYALEFFSSKNMLVFLTVISIHAPTNLGISKKIAKFQPHSCITFPLKPNKGVYQTLIKLEPIFQINAH